MAGERERHHCATGLTWRAFFFSKLGEGNGKGEGRRRQKLFERVLAHVYRDKQPHS